MDHNRGEQLGCVLFTPGNWQDLLLESATYPRPADGARVEWLCEKMKDEAAELIIGMPGEPYPRWPVLLPASHAQYFPDKDFLAAKNSPEMQAHVAGELGDVLWYHGVILAECGISIEEVLTEAALKLGDNPLEITDIANDLERFELAVRQRSPGTAWQRSPEESFHFVDYAHYVDKFKGVASQYIADNVERQGMVEAGAQLLWATTYMLANNCNGSLEQVLSRTYAKLQGRRDRQMQQGSNEEDPRWIDASELSLSAEQLAELGGWARRASGIST